MARTSNRSGNQQAPPAGILLPHDAVFDDDYINQIRDRILMHMVMLDGYDKLLTDAGDLARQKTADGSAMEYASISTGIMRQDLAELLHRLETYQFTRQHP